MLGSGEQVPHKMTNPLLNVCKPVLALSTAVLILKDSFQHLVMPGHMARPDHLMLTVSSRDFGVL